LVGTYTLKLGNILHNTDIYNALTLVSHYMTIGVLNCVLIKMKLIKYVSKTFLSNTLHTNNKANLCI